VQALGLDEPAPKDVVAVMVETRRQTAIPMVLMNMRHRLPDVPIQFFYGQANEDYVKNEPTMQKLREEGELTLTPIPGRFFKNYTWEEHEVLLTSPEIWRLTLPAKKLLTFQTDSWLCPHAAGILKQFMKYDYVGAPWNHSSSVPGDPEVFVGNGGLTLRDRAVMINITETFGPPATLLAALKKTAHPTWDVRWSEDTYFSSHVANKPTPREASKFSQAESFTGEESMGFHKPWSYDNSETNTHMEMPWYKDPTNQKRLEEVCPGIYLIKELRGKVDTSPTFGQSEEAVRKEAALFSQEKFPVAAFARPQKPELSLRGPAKALPDVDGDGDGDTVIYGGKEAQGLYKRLRDVFSVSGVLKGQKCAADGYVPSPLEKGFVEHSKEWADPALKCLEGNTTTADFHNPMRGKCKSNTEALCAHLDAPTRQAWIEGVAGKTDLSQTIFSKLCVKGEAPQLLEPLAGVLRDPRTFCDLSFQDKKTDRWGGYNASSPDKLRPIEWQLWADSSVLKPGGKSIFFDAGATFFIDSMEFTLARYERQGIEFDEIHAWEITDVPTEKFWYGVDPKVRSKWEPRLIRNNGVGVDGKLGSKNNPAELMKKLCRPDDFCAFKMDIEGGAGVEEDIADQLVELQHGVLDEFWEEYPDRDYEVLQPGATFYSRFQKLRSNGVRAHGWI